MVFVGVDDNVVVVSLLLIAHAFNIQLLSINFHLRLLKAYI